MLEYLFLVSVATFVFVFFGPLSGPVVETSKGTVEGTTYQGYSLFFGIPFAQPPIGPLRFQNPKPVKRWRGRLKAVSFKSECMQASAGYDSVAFPQQRVTTSPSEDCLYLNVYTAELKPGTLRPVLLFIHGGAFLSGSAHLNMEEVLQHWVSRGVVVVSIAYRLNVFGFFTTGTPDFPSNIAMMDQIAGMKWVQREIAGFGGDPERVTIVGESAGAFSVSLHTLSPLSQPLFRQALSQSGTAFSPWAHRGGQNMYPPSSKTFALATGCITEVEWELRDFSRFKLCIQLLSAGEISKIRHESVPGQSPGGFVIGSFGVNWAPMIGTSDGFLPEALEKLSLKRKKDMPVITGTERNEMYGWCMQPFENFNNTTFEETVRNFGAESIWGDRAPKVQDLLRKYYAPPANATPIDWFWAVEELESGRNFDSGAVKDAVSLLDTSTNIWAYSFDYLPPDKKWPSYHNISVKGVPHGTIQHYEFWDEGNVSTILAILWTNFVKTGNPNLPTSIGAEWGVFNAKTYPFFSITERPKTKFFYHGKADKVWNQLVPNA